MAFEHNGNTYKSKKHPLLEFIFFETYSWKDEQTNLPFYLKDISDAYSAIDIPEPASISNTILDLCRKNSGIASRVPESISGLGFDLKKKTGKGNVKGNFAGEFVYVGIGNEINSWLVWDENPQKIIVDSTPIPKIVTELIRKDEGALFSVIDYCDVLSKIFGKKVVRIQNPMKWQPNEIDGFYAFSEGNAVIPIEAKALSTKDDINMDQIQGAFQTLKTNLESENLKLDIIPLAIRGTKNGIDIAVFETNKEPDMVDAYFHISFNPKIKKWI